MEALNLLEQRLEAINSIGELAGCGPEWACDQYGAIDHDYFTCPTCYERFETYLAATRSLDSMGLLPPRRAA
jgi:hypothetical protein